MSEALFQALPGQSLPIAEVAPSFARLAAGEVNSADFRATQLNLVLHLGSATALDEGMAVFADALAFAGRYPCRIFVTVPTDAPSSGEIFRAKLHSECFLAGDGGKMCCCEAVVIAYSPAGEARLESQVTAWLEGDLPVNHWFHRIPGARLRGAFQRLVRTAQRALFDSSVEDANYRVFLEGEQWRDLAHARTLSVRQTLGQHLAAHDPAQIIDLLDKVEIVGSQSLCGETRCLQHWLETRLNDCAALRGRTTHPNLSVIIEEPPHDPGLQIRWFDAGRHPLFTWTAASNLAEAVVDDRLGNRRLQFTLPLRQLAPGQALAEALFF